MGKDEKKRLEARIRELEWEVKVYKKKVDYWHREFTNSQYRLNKLYDLLHPLCHQVPTIMLETLIPRDHVNPITGNTMEDTDGA